jgi:malyl-CoA/(S)-citramalyl-CoA lyase
MTAPRLTRTYLAVPAHRARMVQNAAASVADAVFLDLEDAVPPGEKAAALEAAAIALVAHDWGQKTVTVRLNAIDSPSIQDEIARLGGIRRLDAFMIPKAEAVADVKTISNWISAAAGARDAPAEMELLIETARGLINVEALAAADRLVTALHLGVGDFVASIGARSVEIGASPSLYKHVGSAADGHPQTALDLFAYPMMRLLVAARAFGLRAIDGPCGAFHDAVATSATAAKAAAMGFDGKQVIHPSQIEATRNAFIPSDEELAHAKRVMAAMEEAERNGHAAVTVDGKMVDYANIRMIRRLMSFKGEVL